jgi:4-amino-4-deoxy-L-arabinose transferase-like glycosyltransferase
MPLKTRILSWASKNPIATIALFLLAVLLPFVNKAVHNDDALYVWCAQNILKHPLNFYGFNVNWAGQTVSMSMTNLNPPGVCYFLAGVIAIFGSHEIPMHLAMFLVAIVAAAGIYQLARIWCDRPLLAAFIAVGSPVFIVSATTLMCDMPMLALWVWSVVLWERALKSGHAGLYLLSIILATLSALTKYSVFTMMPLLLVIGALRKKSFGPWLLWLIMPVALIEAYEIYTVKLYGIGLITVAQNSATQNRYLLTGGIPDKLVIGLSYLGACLLPAMLFAPQLFPGRRLKIVGCIVLLVCLIASLCLTGFVNTFNDSFPFQMAFYMAGGILIFVLASVQLKQGSDATSFTLTCWLASGFLFAAILNWTIAARSFLPLAPVAAILVVRHLKIPTPSLWPIALSIVISLLVAFADQSLANSARLAAHEFGTYHSGPVWFESHSGFQYYLPKNFRPVDFGVSVINANDCLMMPINGSNMQWPPRDVVIDPPFQQEYWTMPWISTISSDAGAGFYGVGVNGSSGSLPFVFGPVFPEKYFVFVFNQRYVFPTPGYLPTSKQQ